MSKYTLKPLLEAIEKEMKPSPQKVKLEAAINMIADRVGSLNSAYALLEELRDSMRFRDDVDDSITNKLQLKYSTTLLALFVLVAQTGFTMNQSQVDIIINTFASSMTDKQLDDFTAAVKEIM
jgi:hypothetical protein